MTTRRIRNAADAPARSESLDGGGASVATLLKAAFAAQLEGMDAVARTKLTLQLRAEIRSLLPKVQAQMDALTPRTRDWYARDMAIHAAKEELTKGLSPSPMAAYLTLAELGRRLKALDQFAGGES